MGISLAQFTQIAMIAQGDFLKLLRAETKDRSDIFRRIFNTDIYKDFQDQLKQKASDLENKYQDIQKSLLQFARSISYNANSPTAEQLRVQLANDNIADTDQLLTQLAAIITEDETYQQQLNKQKSDVEQQITALEKVFAYQEDLARQFQQLQQAQNRLQELSQENDLFSYKQEQLAIAEQANQVNILEKRYLELCEQQNNLTATINSLCAELADTENNLVMLKTELEKSSDKETYLNDLRTQSSLISQQFPIYDELANKQQELDQDQHNLSKYKQAYQLLINQQQSLQEQQITLKQQTASLHNIEAQLVTAKVELNKAQTAVEAQEKLLSQLEQWQNSNQQLISLQQQYLEAKSHFEAQSALYIQLQTAFLNSQAGILASTLQPGLPCPVCGATDHPHPALLPQEQSSKEMVDQALEDMEKARKISTDLSSQAQNVLTENKLREQNLCTEYNADNIQQLLTDAPQQLTISTSKCRYSYAKNCRAHRKRGRLPK